MAAAKESGGMASLPAVEAMAAGQRVVIIRHAIAVSSKHGAERDRDEGWRIKTGAHSFIYTPKHV